jgi:hypothetical protein
MDRYTRKGVNNLLRKAQGERSLRIFAKDLKISAAYLSDILNCKRHPGPVVLSFLGLRLEKRITVHYAREKANA